MERPPETLTRRKGGKPVITKSDKAPPKTAPVIMRGHIEAKYVRCGKASCRCARGELHGPYYRRAYAAGGRRERHYVRLGAVDTTRAAIAAWRSQRERVRADRMTVRRFRALLRAYGRLSEDVIAALEG